MNDSAIKKILAVILDVGRISPVRAMYVCAFVLDYLQTMQEIADRFGTSRKNAEKHLKSAGIRHPEILALMNSTYRRNVIRQRSWKRRKK